MTTTTTGTNVGGVTDTTSGADLGGVGVREFQGDEVGQVLRLLARQAKVNMVVSEAVTGTVTMRLEDVTALQAVEIIAKSKGLFVDKIDSVYYVKTAAERTAEPTEAESYQFSYGRAKDMARSRRLAAREQGCSRKWTSARTQFSSARRAATSMRSASFWSRSTGQPSRS